MMTELFRLDSIKWLNLNKAAQRIKHLCVLIHIRFKGEAGTVKHVLSKKDGKDQETIQSSTTSDPGYHMGK